MKGVDSAGVLRMGMPRPSASAISSAGASRPLVTTKQEIRQEARRFRTAARRAAESLRRYPSSLAHLIEAFRSCHQAEAQAGRGLEHLAHVDLGPLARILAALRPERRAAARRTRRRSQASGSMSPRLPSLRR